MELLAFVMHYLVLVIPNKEARAAFKKAVVLIGLTEEQVKKLKAIELDFDRAQIKSDAEP